jgi:MinD-like ATPase involved in chromosome partitioning or flagellar assembly
VSLPVVTAVTDAEWEADLAGGLSDGDHGVTVVRRCVDLGDLLAAAAAGLARAVLLSADLRRLDRAAVGRLHGTGVAAIGVAGDEAGQRRLRDLGVASVLARDAPAAEVAGAVHAAVAALAQQSTGDTDLAWSGPGPAPPLAATTEPAVPPDRRAVPAGSGRVIAVWGPAGAPGRSTIAVNLAAELADLGRTTLLVDADTYGGTVAQLVGVLDEAPGVAAACRLANSGHLEVQVRPRLQLLSGITRADRWHELRSPAVRDVLDLARAFADVTVVDCGFCLEQDEELAYDTAAPRRNGATLTSLDVADMVIGVAAADPVGVARYVRALPDCAAVARADVCTVVNRLREKVVGPGDARRQVGRALNRYAGISTVHVVPDDRGALDAALAAGRTLAEAAPASTARLAIRALASTIAGEPPERRRRARRAARRQRWR